MKNIFYLLTACLFTLCGFSQGTLEFNQVLLLSSANGVVTVPAGKVWKIESYMASSARRYTDYSLYGNVNWSITNPNPCTGAITGTSSNVYYYSTAACPSANTAVWVNGQNSNIGQSLPAWLPAATTLEIQSNVCYSGANFTIGAGVPFRDNTSATYLCGPLTVTPGFLNNSPIITLVEFNIVP